MTEHPQQGTGTDPVADFWSWWSGGGSALLDRVFTGQEQADVVAEFAPRVAAIDPGLEWEFGPGSSSRHLVTVTAAGRPRLRGAARRWLAAAPPEDEDWSYREFRVARPEGRITFRGHSCSVDEAVVSPRPGRLSVALAVHHPAFATADEETRAQLGFLLVDAAVGEEKMETWVSTLDFPAQPPEDAIPLRGLEKVIDDFVASLSPTGVPDWVHLEGEMDGSTVRVAVRPPVAALIDPLKELNVEVRVEYLKRMDDGQPDVGSREPLETLTADLVAAAGDDGRLVAIETRAGRRTYRLFVLPDRAVVDRVTEAARRWRQSEVEVEPALDPGWQAVRHLRL